MNEKAIGKFIWFHLVTVRCVPALVAQDLFRVRHLAQHQALGGRQARNGGFADLIRDVIDLDCLFAVLDALGDGR